IRQVKLEEKKNSVLCACVCVSVVPVHQVRAVEFRACCGAEQTNPIDEGEREKERE
uniref:Uncharacterized protein n=1 Tax=Anopheles quadriannulatus TaxID=34691 RepID=A0A182XQM1_ANOQN